jgi:hypothetical protein
VSAAGKIKASYNDDVTINAWIRTHLSPNGDMTFSICKLSATGGSVLTSTYSPALIKTLETSVKKPGSAYAQIGDSITLPTFTTYSGRDASGKSVDTVPPPFPAGDGDGHPGVTIPTTVIGLLTIDVYTGLVITTTMSGVKLFDATTMKGETSFQTEGVVFGSTSTALVPPDSTIDVTTNDAKIPFTAVKLDSDGSTTCEDIAKRP